MPDNGVLSDATLAIGNLQQWCYICYRYRHRFRINCEPRVLVNQLDTQFAVSGMATAYLGNMYS